ncbi:MAG: polyphenol oxidase family protein, partial [Myxococcota bacterium]
GAVLAVLVADCVPVLMADRDGTVIAAVHAGWRGTEARIVEVMVKRLKDAGVAPETLLVALGPAISQDSFEIGPEVAEALGKAFPKAGAALRPGEGDRFHADLWALNQQVLLEAGVPAESIDVLRLDTVGQSELFSYRGDGGETGRQAGVIAFAS